MRYVYPNDDTGMWEVRETEVGDSTVATFESESIAMEFAAVPELLAACEAFVEARRKWRSDNENETIDSITYLDMLDAIDFDAAIAKARNRSFQSESPTQNMGQGKHTALPWTLRYDPPGYERLIHGGDGWVCRVMLRGEGRDDEVLANSEMIVLAVNERPTLLAQRDKAVELLQSLLDMGSTCTGDSEIIENNRRRAAARAFLETIK